MTHRPLQHTSERAAKQGETFEWDPGESGLKREGESEDLYGGRERLYDRGGAGEMAYGGGERLYERLVGGTTDTIPPSVPSRKVFTRFL